MLFQTKDKTSKIDNEGAIAQDWLNSNWVSSKRRYRTHMRVSPGVIGLSLSLRRSQIFEQYLSIQCYNKNNDNRAIII